MAHVCLHLALHLLRVHLLKLLGLALHLWCPSAHCSHAQEGRLSGHGVGLRGHDGVARFVVRGLVAAECTELEGRVLE